MSVDDKLQAASPKKLLALDGGGIRGILTIEVLAALEEMLRRELGRDDGFRLSDYFDYVAGTSTGAIIATSLALGMRVSEVRQMYIESGNEMFEKSGLLRRVFYKYRNDKLSRKLKEVIGERTTLDDPRLRTLLMMVLRNASTDSPWPVSNNPCAKYNDRSRPDCNLDLPLWRLVRASTAAPTYFPAGRVEIGPHEFVFVDGGVTTYNNPAFHLFLMATTEPFKLNWPTGQDELLLVSIGTGASPQADANLRTSRMHLLHYAKRIPSALMYAALNEQDFLCRVFGDCRVGDPLDNEVGDMIGAAGPARPKLFTYLRYNAELTPAGIKKLGLSHIDPGKIQALDSVDYIPQLQEVGQAVGRQLERGHFQGFLA
jgi:uncharacterized protein